MFKTNFTSSGSGVSSIGVGESPVGEPPTGMFIWGTKEGTSGRSLINSLTESVGPSISRSNNGMSVDFSCRSSVIPVSMNIRDSKYLESGALANSVEPRSDCSQGNNLISLSVALHLVSQSIISLLHSEWPKGECKRLIKLTVNDSLILTVLIK